MKPAVAALCLPLLFLAFAASGVVTCTNCDTKVEKAGSDDNSEEPTCVSYPRMCIDVEGGEARQVVILNNGLEVLCDTETDGGGWVVFQRRASEDVDFYRDWDSYKYGFGDLTGNFWLGLEKVHKLTTEQRHELRVDISYKGKSYHAIYNQFKVLGEAELYTLKISGFSDNAPDDLSRHNGFAFTTKGRDNDVLKPGNCAQKYRGGWWYFGCHWVNLNGLWDYKKGAEGMVFANITSFYDSVSFSEMKMRPIRNRRMCLL
ncbi:ryncolin-1-like [Aplysia californica]|uniref:Ryncolin-1-like n=1 Tax=Aplysia californica TaxID=6500 RepID=A0ABM0K944_APLCA|nr:ryncolin-1-like [Aplysia californica]